MKYPHSIPKADASIIPTVYSRGFILENYGCYFEKQALDLPYDQEGNIHIEVLKEHIPIKDFCWFLINRVFGSTQRAWFALDCAKFVLPVFEKAYPNDERVAKCIEATEKLITEGSYIAGTSSVARAVAVYCTGRTLADSAYATTRTAAARSPKTFPSFVQDWISPYLHNA